MARDLTIVASVLLVVMTLVPERAAADGSWLDSPATDWNTPGIAIPQAPRRDPAVNLSCPDGRPPASPREQAVVDAGWLLYGSFSRGGPVEQMSGLTGYDGMCRPVGYQYFFFVDGVFAGTLSPVPMISRSDGALNALEVRNDEDLTARYARYTPQDPLCCPSATTTAVFKIERTADGPIVSLRSLATAPNGPLPPAPTPTPGRPPIQAPVQAPVQLPRSQ